MSIKLVPAKKITKVVEQLYDLHANQTTSDAPHNAKLNKALDDIFFQAAKVDITGVKSDKENLYFTLWKANQVSLDHAVEKGNLTTQDRLSMEGDDPIAYKRAIHKEITSLAPPIEPTETKSSGLIRDSDGIAHLAGMLTSIEANIDVQAVPEEFMSNLANLSSAIVTHAVAMNPDYSEEPTKNGIQPIARSLIALSRHGDSFFEASRAIDAILFDDREVVGQDASGSTRIFSGSDVFMNIAKEILEGKKEIHLPLSHVKTDVAFDSLYTLAGVDPNVYDDGINTASSKDFGLVMSALHEVESKLPGVTFYDYEGNTLENDVANHMAAFTLQDNIQGLSERAVSSKIAFTLGFKNKAESPVVDNDFSF